MALTPGTRVADLLEIGEALPEMVGAPMLGRVHRATELDTGREQWVVAIGPEFAPTDTKRGELTAGAKQSGKLGGPGVLAPGLVLTHGGETIVGHVPPPGALGFALSGLWGNGDAVIPLAVELAYALARMHEASVVHGAFCLGSVCVADGHAWTWQQGLAQAFEPGALAAQARKLRSMQPFPPEFLAFGGRPTTGTDVYAWGMTVTQMISGRPDDSAAKDIASGLGELDSDHPLVRVLKSCLNENASARPRDALEVVSRLEGEGYTRPEPSSFADTASSGTGGAAPKSKRSAKRTIFSPGSLPTPPGGPGDGGVGLPPPPTHGRMSDGALPPPPSHPADDFPAPELAQGVPNQVGRSKDESAAPPPPPPPPPKRPPPPPQGGAPTMVPGHGPPQGGPPVGPRGMDPTMVPGMGGPQYPHPGQYAPPPGYGPPGGPAPGPNYAQVHPGAQHVPAAAPMQGAAMDDFAASLDRAIALETGDAVGLSGGPASGGDSGLHEPDRIDLQPSDSAQGELVLDRALEGLDGNVAPVSAAKSISGPMLPGDDDDHDQLPEPGVAPVVHTESKSLSLPRKPGPHGWESRPLTLLAVFLPLVLLSAAVAFLGPEAGGFDVFAGLAPRAGDEEANKYAPIEEKDYSIPDFGSGVVVDLPEVKKKCEYGTVIIDGDVCIDQGEAPGMGQLPTTRISYEEAQAACNEKGARLCTKEEFKTACMGKKGTRFPYGDFFKDYCNVSDGVSLPRVRASGASGKCRSEIGTYDQVGNVGEWIDGGEVMGGDVRTNGQSAMCKSRGKPPKGFKGEFVGFRCCYDRD